MNDSTHKMAPPSAGYLPCRTCMLLPLILLAFLGCVKDTEYVSTPVEYEGDFWFRESRDESDGYVSMTFRESFYGPPNGVGATFAAGFGHKGVLIDAGAVSINDTLDIPILDDNRFLLYYPWEGQVFQGEEVAVSFHSSTGKYKSFTEDIYVPKQMQFHSNIGIDGLFYKSKDLELTWAPDENIDKAYIWICVDGTPCLPLEVPDDGSYTIPSSNFSDFPVGNGVMFFFCRGVKRCLDNGYKKISITVNNYVYASLDVAE